MICRGAMGALALGFALIAAAVTAAPAPPPRRPPGDFEAALRNFRDVGALAIPILMLELNPSVTAEARTALYADSVQGQVAWKVFFQGALWIPASESDRDGVAAFFNPVYDDALVTRWRRIGPSWQLTQIRSLTGAAVRGESPTPLPNWVVDQAHPPARDLAFAPIPTPQQIVALAADLPAVHNDALATARIVALKNAAGGRNLPGVRNVARLFRAMEDGDAAELSAAGAASSDAQSIARLPADLRHHVVAFGAVKRKSGDLVVAGPAAGPGLIYLIRRANDGAVTSVAALAVGLGRREVKPS